MFQFRQFQQTRTVLEISKGTAAIHASRLEGSLGGFIGTWCSADPLQINSPNGLEQDRPFHPGGYHSKAGEMCLVPEIPLCGVQKGPKESGPPVPP